MENITGMIITLLVGNIAVRWAYGTYLEWRRNR